jgi:uncharacterized damage-inducible protein DinB
MKDLIIALGEYNRKVNEALVKLLKGADAKALREDQGSYYKSVLGTLEHIAVSEVVWLKRFAGFLDYPSLSGSKLVKAELDDARKRAAAGMDSLFALLAEADAALVALAGEVKEGKLSEKASYTNIHGQDFTRPVWSMLVHILNHGIHHRGEISALLDRKGIANDISGFTTYVD